MFRSSFTVYPQYHERLYMRWSDCLNVSYERTCPTDTKQSVVAEAVTAS